MADHGQGLSNQSGQQSASSTSLGGDTSPTMVSIAELVSRPKNDHPVYTCDQCQPAETFAEKEGLRNHQLTHDTPKYPCMVPGCYDTFQTEDQLDRHQQKHELEHVDSPGQDRADASVLELTHSCLLHLQQLTDRGDDLGNMMVTRLADVRLWADGVGATAHGGNSLDRRFMTRPDDLMLVKSILIMLDDFIDEYAQLDASQEAIEESLQRIDSTIENLAIIGVAIRRTGKASRRRKADIRFDPSEHNELKLHLECIVLTRPSQDGIQGPPDPSRLSILQRRLIEANLRRRHRFVLAQKRSRGAGATRWRNAAEVMSDSPTAEDDMSSEALTQSRARGTRRLQRTHLKGKQPDSASHSYLSLASTAEGSLQYQPKRKFTPGVAKTQITALAAEAEFPRPPQPADGRLIGKCPCCCQSMHRDDLMDPKKWKQHLVEDLCPYTCIIEDCPEPHLLFSTRKEWEAHVSTAHAVQWLCPLCEDHDVVLPTEAGAVDHFNTYHHDDVESLTLATLLTWAETQRMHISNCPLCSSVAPEDSPELINHILRHVYEFSMRALPWPTPVVHDPSQQVGTFALPEDEEEAALLESWVETVDSGSSANLQLSSFDDIRLWQAEETEPDFDPFAYVPIDEFFDETSSNNSSRLQVRLSEPDQVIDGDMEEQVIDRGEVLVPLDTICGTKAIALRYYSKGPTSDGKPGKLRVLIGSDPECDIVVDDPLVSAHHCAVWIESVQDDSMAPAHVTAMSPRGTWINDARLVHGSTRPLQDGDEIALYANARFTYYHPRRKDEDPRFLDEYTLLEKLGKGHFAEVFLCVEKSSGTRYAVKIFTRSTPKSQSAENTIVDEVSILRGLKHPNILCLQDVFFEEKAIYAILELAPEGELFNFIVTKQKLSEDEARKLFGQLFDAVKYLHDRDIMHHDIKPENILLADKDLHVKLADFGTAKILGDEDYNAEDMGMSSYVAPEILEPRGARKYTKAVDIWSLGVVLYICLCGFPPFSDELYSKEFPYTLSQQIKAGRFDYPSPYWDAVGDPALDLIDSMLVVDPEKRYTIEQCLAHPWLDSSGTATGESGSKGVDAKRTRAVVEEPAPDSEPEPEPEEEDDPWGDFRAATSKKDKKKKKKGTATELEAVPPPPAPEPEPEPELEKEDDPWGDFRAAMSKKDKKKKKKGTATEPEAVPPPPAPEPEPEPEPEEKDDPWGFSAVTSKKKKEEEADPLL